MVIAIDGTVCSGKSTISRELAKKIGFLYCNTGAIYRSITVKILNEGLENASEDEICEMLERTEVKLERNENGGVRAMLDGVDITYAINTPLISQNVSIYSKIPCVRAFAHDVQVDLAKNGNIVVEGRDIGTVVFPNAEVKIFMTANDDVRAKRRQADYLKQGKNLSLEDVKKEILERDKADMEREISPLKKADDAIMYYNNGSDINKVLDDIIEIINAKEPQI